MSLPNTLLLFLGVYFTGSFLYVIFFERQNLENTDRAIITLFAVFKLVICLSHSPGFFLGLEYEDAYIWSANALFLDKYQGFDREKFITSSCLFGSVDHCMYTGSFSSHTILFPTILWGVSKITGFSPYIASWTNLFFSVLLIGRIYKVSLLLIENRTYACLTVLILVTTPIISVYHTTGFVEMFSSYMLLSCLYYYLAYERAESKRWLLFTLFVASFIVAVFTKRENLLLVAIPFIGWIGRLVQGRPHQVTRVFAEVVPLAAIIITYLATTGTLLTEISEVADIGGPTFSVSYFIRLAPSLLAAVSSFNWFSLCSLFICVGFLLAVVDFQRAPLLLYPGILSLSYLVLYLIHYRSYYFIHYADVTSMEWLRYLTNIYPSLCLVGGYTLFILSQIRINVNWVLPVLELILVAVQVRQAPELQRQLYQRESEARIKPVTNAIEFMGQKGELIITETPLLFQMFGGSHLELLDVYSIKSEIGSHSMKDLLLKYNNIYFVRRKDFDSEEDRKRFPGYREVLNTFEARKIKELGRGHDLYELKIKDSLTSHE